MSELALPLIGDDDISIELRRENLRERKIVINNTIDENLIENATLYILKWNADDHKNGIPKERRKPIFIYLHSYGGDVSYGIAFLSTIQASVTPIYTIILGMAASMARYIPMVSDKSYAVENASICLHDGEVGVVQTRRKANDFMDYTNKCDERLNKIILENTNITQEKLDEIADKEFYIFADEAKELGIIDAIIGVDVQLEEIL